MIYIIRHGQTQMNQAFALQGRTDLPLNEMGIRQAKQTGCWFRDHGIRIDKVYTSPLDRAVKTAQLVIDVSMAPAASDVSGASIPVLIDDRLIEMDYGPYEGMNLKHPVPEVLEFFQDFVNHPAPTGMEPLADVVGRLGTILEEIREEAAERNILISTHAIAMKGALEYLTPDSNGSYWSRNIRNCAVYRARVIDGRFTVPEELETEVQETL